MTSSFLSFLILSGFIGFHCEVTTVRKMSVKAGSSISIPCLYGSSYSGHVKYLCKGSRWRSCSIAVRTDKPDETEKFSISDDREQNIFTVVINHIDESDKSWYWCAVEKAGIILDIMTSFWLSVTTDGPSLYVDQQEITAQEGGSVTVLCRNKHHIKRGWCRLGSNCVAQETGSIQGTTVTINDTVPNAFNVTMSGLRTQNSGWYWCDSGDLQMPVHITVHKITSTTGTAANTNTNTARATPKTTKSFSVPNAGPSISSPIHPTEGQTDGESLQDEHKSSTKTTILIICVVFLLLLVAAAILGWRMMIQRKSKPEASDMTGDSRTGSDSDVQYSEIQHKTASSVQMKNKTSEDSATYSNIVMKDRTQQATEPTDGGVIYSTVQKQN